MQKLLQNNGANILKNMLYIRKLFTQDLRDGKQIAFPKEPSYSFFSYDFVNKEADRKISFAFSARFEQFQDYDGIVINTRLYAAGSEARMDGEVKAFIRDKLNAKVGDLLIFKNKGNKFIEYEFMFVPQDSEFYPALLKLCGGENHSVYDLDEYPIVQFEEDLPLQLIYFGAPGTSKSTTIKREVGACSQHRITFHPDTDYSNFVGCYKPTKDTNGHDITYEFVAQTFVKAYIEAWKKLADDNQEEKRVFLIIEEINRGNCAQIFGDLFQLLDRDDNGYSDYSIEPDADLQRFLEKEFDGSTGVPEAIAKGSVMQLPPNLFIWATMNTSDQSLFPIDSAFKRRWEWKYLPIKNDGKGHIIRVDDTHAYDWWEFLNAVNNRIEKLTEQEDKQLGYWFAKPNKGVDITVDRFVSKVVFYLWNDVFKDFAKDANSPFVIKGADDKRHELKFNMFFDGLGNAIPSIVAVFIEGLKVEPIQNPEPTPSDRAETIEEPEELTNVPEEQIDEPEETEEQDLTDAEEEREIAEYNESFESRVNTDEDEPEETITTEGDLFGNSVQTPGDNDDDDDAGTGNADADNFLKSLYNRR